MTSSITEQATYARVLTPTGRGAIAVIEVTGPLAIQAVSHCFQSRFQPFKAGKINAIRFGKWNKDQGEELIAVRTGETTAEIHCHGGSAASAAILTSLVKQGAQVATDTVAKLSLEEAACNALQQAPTEKVAAILLDQAQGALTRGLEEIVDSLDQKDCDSAKNKIDKLLSWPQVSKALTQPLRVVLAGPPNVGKSSLINALVGYDRAIVYDQPGTTRDVVTSTTAIDGWPVQLADTAGLRETDEPIEAAGVALAKQTLLSADLVLIVIEATQFGTEKSSHFIKEMKLLLPSVCQTLIVTSKVDLLQSEAALPKEVLATSTFTGKGVMELLSQIASTLVPKEPQQGEAIPFSEAQTELLKNMSEDLSKGKSETVKAALIPSFNLRTF